MNHRIKWLRDLACEVLSRRIARKISAIVSSSLLLCLAVFVYLLVQVCPKNATVAAVLPLSLPGRWPSPAPLKCAHLASLSNCTGISPIPPRSPPFPLCPSQAAGLIQLL